MKKTLLPIIFLLSFTPVLAMSVSTAPVEDTVYPGEDVTYTLNITNDGSVKDTFHVVSWSTWTATISNTLFELEPNQTKQLNASFTIPIDVQVQKNELRIDISNDEQEEQETIQLIAHAKTLYPQGFSLKSYTFPNKVDPREDAELTAVVETELDKRLPGALRFNVKDSGSEQVLVQEQSYSYDPRTNNSLRMSVSFPDNQSPGKYFLEVEAYVTSRLIGRKTGSFNIMPYTSITQTPVQSTGVLGQTRAYTITNNGTGLYENYTVTEKVDPLTAFLVTNSFGGAYSDGEYEWVVDVQPGETVTVGYTTSFLPLILLPFALITLAYVYWRLTRKIVVKKEIVGHETKEHHTVVKVLLRVKNKSRDEIKNIALIDPLTPFVSKVGKFQTLKPKLKGSKSQENKRLVWKIDSIKAGDELVLSYTAHTKVGIMGRMFFEPATAQFKHKGKKYEEKSNIVGFEATE